MVIVLSNHVPKVLYIYIDYLQYYSNEDYQSYGSHTGRLNKKIYTHAYYSGTILRRNSKKRYISKSNRLAYVCMYVCTFKSTERNKRKNMTIIFRLKNVVVLVYIWQRSNNCINDRKKKLVKYSFAHCFYVHTYVARKYNSKFTIILSKNLHISRLTIDREK